MQAWLLLALAIALEVAGTTSMKLSDGMHKIFPTIMIFVFYGLTFAIMPFVIKKIEMGTVYAIWAGAGTVLVTFIGIWYFKESSSTIKLMSIGLICIGVIGLNLVETSTR
ncbi:multidrug efflux SMR transporter [Sulfuricurvum sp.]|jgi:small multidrug resistance pump|uniref:DMT family transporter n=1 Tax=Sulfuricurvum sp. TaxID=2025608 RepID=UPI00356A22B5